MIGTQEYTTGYWLKLGEVRKGISSAIVLITKYNASLDDAMNDLNLPPESKEDIIRILQEQNYEFA